MSDTLGTPSQKLRTELARGPIFAAGCYDALSARLVQEAGFPVGYISGLAVEATQLGSADVGLITRTEMAAHAARMATAVDIPLVCDVDTGYGDVVNVAKTIRELHRAGIAGIQIEDQVDPKRCPLLGPPEVLETETAVRRVAACVESKPDPNFFVIARTDAYQISLSAVIERSNRYLDAGADATMSPLKAVDGRPMASLTPDEQMEWLEHYVSSVHGPVVGMQVPAGRTVDDMMEIGFKMVVLPTVTLYSAATAMMAALRSCREQRGVASHLKTHPYDPAVTGIGLLNLLGAEEVTELTRCYGPIEEASG